MDIPTVTFSDALIEGDSVKSNFLGEYIAGVYKYLLGIGTLIAIVMIMVSGLQYSLGAGGGDIKKAQDRIKNAVTGVILLLSAYFILYTVNPNLTVFPSLTLTSIPNVGLLEIEAAFVNGTVATEFASPSEENITGPGVDEIPADLAGPLDEAAKVLAEAGYGMSVRPSFRTVAEQTEQIYQKCNNPPGSKTCDPKDGKTTACMLTNGPSSCPHTTGNALDIWGTEIDSEGQCITQQQCNPSLGANDPCRLNKCQAALIAAMKDAGFCNLASEAWHFEMPKMSETCN